MKHGIGNTLKANIQNKLNMTNIGKELANLSTLSFCFGKVMGLGNFIIKDVDPFK